jgi:hypothetical protein
MDKSKKPTVVFKNVRPRVDTRWKKTETVVTASVQRETVTLKKVPVKEPIKVTATKVSITREYSHTIPDVPGFN